MQDKINIILSTYNSLDDLRLNIDIFRYNFKKTYNLIVSINDKDTFDKAKQLDGLDSVVLGSTIPFEGSFPYVRIHARTYDSIRSGFLEACKYNAEYSVHNHADAIFLQENKLLDVIDKMKVTKKLASIRGRGFGWYYKYSSIGMVDDHFFFINNELIKKGKIFNQEAFELLPTRNNVHGILAMMVLSNIGLKNILFHSNVNNLSFWDDVPVVMTANYMRPMSIDKDLGFLHINKKSFLHKHAQQLLAHYLYSNNLIRGEYIEYLLDTFLIDKTKLFEELKELEIQQNKVLKLYLYDKSYINHREFSTKQYIIKNTSLKHLLGNICFRLKKTIQKSLCQVHPNDNRIYYESLREKNLIDYYNHHFQDLDEEISFLKANYIM